MAGTAVRFLMIQEAKVEDQEVKAKEDAAKGKGWSTVINPCCFGGGGGKSAGVAIACRRHIGMSESFENKQLPAALKGRFMVKQVGAMCKGGVHLATGYLHS